MSERKVFQKYYPPDFDPRLIPRKKTAKDFKQHEIRAMLPMNVRCSTCGEFLYAGKKFNARKELCEGEDYVGIKVFRFYIKCTSCRCEIIFKTDPKNADYIVEAGAIRNFEPWKQKEAIEHVLREQRAREDEEDSMKALENRTLESKREMDRLDALEEIRELNKAQARGDAPEQALERLRLEREAEARRQQAELERQIEADSQKFFQKLEAESGQFVRRLADDGADDDEDGTGASLFSVRKAQQQQQQQQQQQEPPAQGVQVALPVPALPPGLVVVSKEKKSKKDKKEKKKKDKEHRKRRQPGEGEQPGEATPASSNGSAAAESLSSSSPAKKPKLAVPEGGNNSLGLALGYDSASDPSSDDE